MSRLMDEILVRARTLDIPFSAHLDLTYRCNERCLHCYVDQNSCEEMTTGEVKSVLEQLAASGALLLSVSGGEPFVRQDVFDILEHARRLAFHVHLKTNGTLIDQARAGRIRSLNIHEVQVSIYSHHADVHDGVTGINGSLDRSLEAIRLLHSVGQRVIIAHIVMRRNASDHPGVLALAEELGVGFRIDPTLTPRHNGDLSPVGMNMTRRELVQVFRTPAYVNDVEAFCAPPKPVGVSTLDRESCRAGLTHVYISPAGDVHPCSVFRMNCGNVRRERFDTVWRESPQLRQLRSIRYRDLSVCSGCSHLDMCSRCPALALVEGDLLGRSRADCEKSYARTGIVPTGCSELEEGKFQYWKET